MAISIKDPEAEMLARRLSALTGETLTETIRVALLERYDRLRRARTGGSLADNLNEIGLRCARRPVVLSLGDNEILGYDEYGAPTR